MNELLSVTGGGDDKKADVGSGNANFQFVSIAWVLFHKGLGHLSKHCEWQFYWSLKTFNNRTPSELTFTENEDLV